ncbi:hypothetical protein [Spirosoma sp. KUDC1026]|uniref:hypothetical protein n=1 Tax=Spirosoma sp. KUDC1026 TaxID=2745947 RepID=UPI00159BBB4B|nr:hypothetical protein [Spirosoma sp. KUDC1026]QKZ15902.1 hypothetical protein HU175_24605 [Spirosoma sp. KUDC1026]
MRVYALTTKQGVGQLITDLVGDLGRWTGEKPLELTLRHVKKRRTLNQNALYWQWCSLIANETGDDRESVHAAMGRMFLPCRLSRIDKTPVAVSTTSLSTKEMSEYMEKIQAWAGQYLNMTLPTPDDLIDYSCYER